MVKTKAQEIMYAISEVLYHNGKYGMERIAIICEILSESMQMIGWSNNFNYDPNYINNVFYQVCSKQKINNYLLNKDQEQIIELFKALIKENKLDIANSIKQLVENDKKTSGLIATDDFSVKVMQTFAKKMYKGGIYIDPCIGTGRLLAGLGADSYYGFDVDRNAIKIAETYLNLIENNSNKTRLNIKLSTENFLYRSFGLMDNIYNPTYIFDPPLNNLIEMNPMLQEYLYRNGIYSNGNKIPSEYAFLTQVLFGTHIDECCYICIFTNNFLFAQDKFKTSFRKYLFENSLIAVIQSNFSETTGVQKLILVGKSRLENPQNNLRYLITFKDKDISEQNISQIAQKCLNNEIFDEKEFYDIAKVQAYTLEEIKENDYQISMPQYYENEIDPNDIKSLSEIVDKLKESNENLINISKDLMILTNNLLDGVKNIKENKNKLEPQKSDINVRKSTNKGKRWYEVEKTDDAVALNIIMNEANILDERSKNLYQVNFELTDSIIQILFDALQEANDNERILVECNKFYINTTKNVKKKDDKISLIELICKFNERKLQYLSQKQINLYKLLINYYLTSKYSIHYPKFEYPIKIEEFSNNDIFSTLYTLKTLGVIQENKNYIIQNNNNIELKNLDTLCQMYNPFNGVVYFDYSIGGTND